jgi:hypothetical protein
MLVTLCVILGAHYNYYVEYSQAQIGFYTYFYSVNQVWPFLRSLFVGSPTNLV